MPWRKYKAVDVYGFSVASQIGGGKQRMEIRRCSAREFFQTDAAKLGQECGSIRYVGRFVTLAAKWNRREKRRVGFHQDPIGWRVLGDFANGLCRRIGEVPGEGDVEAHIERAASLVEITGEAVHDASEACGLPVVGDGCQEVLPGLG